jgi:hypothetical protein
MTLAAAKLRAVVNLLSDPLQAHAAAGVLATEAKARNVLVSDLIAGALAPPRPGSPGCRRAARSGSPKARSSTMAKTPLVGQSSLFRCGWPEKGTRLKRGRAPMGGLKYGFGDENRGLETGQKSHVRHDP